jgi:predicted flap endonuclease-1-like 5' DNA nuclease
MSYSISDLETIGPEVAELLKKRGIRTSEKFLAAARSAKGRRQLALDTGLDEKFLLRLANLIDRMRIKGVGEDYAELLREVGVETIRELKHRNAAKLVKAMRDANAKRRLVQFLPSEKNVVRWIVQAKHLPPMITY